MGATPLKMQFFSLYSIVNYPHASVANVMNHRPLNISFRRVLVGDKQTTWNNLVAIVSNIQLSNERHTFTWDLHRHGVFSVRSMYQYLMNLDTPFSNKFIWKLKLPLKIRIFLWYVQRGVILTKDNLAKRNWFGNQM